MAHLQIKIYPNAPRNQVMGLYDGIWKIRICAPPVDGKANAKLIDFLSQLLGTAKSNVSVEKGHSARNKVLNVKGMDENTLISLLAGSR